MRHFNSPSTVRVARALCVSALLFSAACVDETVLKTDSGDSQSPTRDDASAASTADSATPPLALDAAVAEQDASATSDAATSASDCYSPTQNLDTAYETPDRGCPCTAQDEDVCTGGVALVCQAGRWQAVHDGPCFPMSTTFTPEACSAAGGVAMADPGDGSLLRAGCPQGMHRLGSITGYIEGGLCCRKVTADACAPQDARMVGSCEPAPRYFWQGNGCQGSSGCSCVGSDCAAGFASLEACEAAFSGCQGKAKPCGGWLGDTCADNEYCAYRGFGLCGAADASATCQPRPQACDTIYDPVCGCDGKTHSNDCEAAMKGTGVAQYKPCK